MKKAFITGITGQDGSYLAELLLHKGYEVHGLIRRSSVFNTQRIEHLYQDPHEADARLFLHYGDLGDGSMLSRLLARIEPDEIYALGAQSHVRVSFDAPIYTGDTTGLGALRLLEAIRETEIPCKYYQASSSEMFGGTKIFPQNEQTPFYPRSPYGVAKVAAYWYTVNYREAYNIFAVNGILFNHESPRRGETFVTKKITRTLSKILAGKEKFLYLGNLEAKRDWGYAPEFVEAMWRMLHTEEPKDYVIATGETHTVGEFLAEACSLVNLDPKLVVKHDDRYFRPTEVDLLLGDAGKAKEKLNWEPKITFNKLVRIMLASDMREQGLDIPFEVPDEGLTWRKFYDRP